MHPIHLFIILWRLTLEVPVLLYVWALQVATFGSITVTIYMVDDNIVSKL